MKKFCFLLPVLIIFGVLLCSCDEGLAIVGMEIKDYPSRIVYVAGVDNKVDLSGGYVYYLLKDRERDMKSMNESQIVESDNANFSTPGVYTVTLAVGKAVCQFPVQVIDKGFIEEFSKK